MRLIDANALKEYITKAYEEMKSEFKTDKYRDIAKLVTESFCMDIDEAPTIDADIVKHGHWVEENTRTHSMQFKCSVCGGIAYYPQNHHMKEPKRCGYRYCGHCGAKMDE